ncbi:MAG: DUF1146 domain-containing protein [Bacilli bacterium]|nr:DUF1146 domain-containing protein [Bacilli bacterium]
MDTTYLFIVEFFFYFVIFAVVFQAFNAIDLSKIFKKNHTWQIQIIYIFSAIAFSYLVVKALMNLISLSLGIFQ